MHSLTLLYRRIHSIHFTLLFLLKLDNTMRIVATLIYLFEIFFDSYTVFQTGQVCKAVLYLPGAHSYVVLTPYNPVAFDLVTLRSARPEVSGVAFPTPYF